jgi:SAM-dependent methyltransferase
MALAHEQQRSKLLSDDRLAGKEAFSRLDESEDSVFYVTDRFVQHLDSVALGTVEELIGSLIWEENPVILDLMAGWDSHIPNTLKPQRVVGLGLNRNELARNRSLTEWLLHDLNKDPRLPFPDGMFDAVLNTVSVDYMIRPVEVFREAGRILKPGGLLLVAFSNRMFEGKATKIWRESGETERIDLVKEIFGLAGVFDNPSVFISKGRPRPQDDKYAHLGIPSDPIYALYADRRGGIGRKRSTPQPYPSKFNPEEVARRTAAVKDTLRCPHCDEGLRKWAVPQNPFSEWDTDFLYVCFNDGCPYLVRGWEVMFRQGNRGLSYRFSYHPLRDRCMSIPVQTLHAGRDVIID